MAALALALLAALTAETWSDHHASHRDAYRSGARHLDLLANLAAHEIRTAAGGTGVPSAEQVRALSRSFAADPHGSGSSLYVSDRDGFIIASGLPSRLRASSFADLFGQLGDAPEAGTSNVLSGTLRDGTPVIAALREFGAGQLALVRPLSEIVDRAPFMHGSRWLVLLGCIGVAGLAGIGIWFAQRAGLAGRTCSRLTRRLDASLVQGRCGVLDWDLTRNEVSLSASMYDLLGYQDRKAPLTPEEVCSIIRPQAASLLDLVATAAACPTARLDHEVRARTASGAWLWLRIKAEVVDDPIDGSRHMVGLAADVTDARGQADRRAASDLRLRDAVEALSEAFVLYDAEDRLILCNSKFRDLHGLTVKTAAPGTTRHDLQAVMQRPVAEIPLAVQSRDLPGTRRHETQLPDGRWLQVNERRTRDGGVVSVETDVSAIKRSEALLREREQRLKGSVREAETAAQHFAALAERNFEENQAKTEFLARMSHELRTPLNAIIGFAEMMRHEILGPLGCRRYAEYSEDIHASGLKLLDVVDGILQIARLEAGNLTISPEMTRIEVAVEDAIASLRPELVARDISVATDISGPILIEADRQALHDILIQLLRNAIRFTETGCVIRICARAANGRMNLFVEDAGPGIAPEVLPRIGHAFAATEAEYVRSGGGAGLGLAIVRGLAELHGGALRVRSALGIGTIALVQLPIARPLATKRRDEESSSVRHLHLMAAE